MIVSRSVPPSCVSPAASFPASVCFGCWRPSQIISALLCLTQPSTPLPFSASRHMYFFLIFILSTIFASLWHPLRCPPADFHCLPDNKFRCKTGEDAFRKTMPHGHATLPCSTHINPCILLPRFTSCHAFSQYLKPSTQAKHLP